MADVEEPTPFTVSIDSKEIPCNRSGTGPVRLIFTHGAGGTITSEGMANFSAGFAKDPTASIICFQGNMNLKSRVRMFDAVHDNVIKTYKHETPIALGGRSMGARGAVMAAMEDTRCLILASYPLQTDKEVRDQILLDLPAAKDVLFISGDHDSMCDLEMLNEVRRKMKAKSWLIRVRDADHGMNAKPKRATRAIGEETGSIAAAWLHERKDNDTEREIWWGVDEAGENCVHSGRWTNASGSTLKKETKVLPSNSNKARDNQALDSKHKKSVKAMPSRTKKLKVGSSSTKSYKDNKEDNKEDNNVDPETEPRRSKRRKVTS
jgi:predicted alpha/beta-hydrolase family hydrolase